jgi:hypothetical protein
MAGFFSRKSDKSKIRFVDLDGQPLKEGDTVMSLRYDMGESRIIKTEEGLAYESLKTGEKVSYTRMIDAATGYQKVKLLGP